MTYKLQDLIDMEHFQNLQDRLNEIYSFPSAIIDNEGNILTATAWQDICTKFHRINSESVKVCIQSDQFIISHLHEANPAVSYRCPHGLVDNATPIVIEGVHYGNFFTGQFFLEKPDLEFFRVQAKKYGFDETSYLDAVKKVPIWSEEQLKNYLFFIKGLIAIISESGLKNLREIETRKKIEENEESARAIFSQMHDGFWITDPVSGRIVDANEAMCRMVGYTHEELMRLSLADIVVNDPPEVIRSRSERIIEDGSAQFESVFRCKDGSAIEVEVSVSYLSKRHQFFCFHRDVTERNRMAEESRKTQKLESLGILAGGIAHDFNNLLGGIYGYIDMANENLPSGKPASYLSKALHTIDRARGLTQQLLTFAKGGAPVQRVEQLFPFVQETALFALSGSAVSCACTVPNDLWPSNFDRNQIGQVIDNIVINAQQAMPMGGTLDIAAGNVVVGEAEHRLLAQGNYVKVSVRDYGIGIPKELLERIFDPFFTTKAKGHGLGLATCYSIIKRHGGCIEVESEPGRGSVFHVYLPAADGTPVVPGKPAEGEHRGSGIVIVMDDEEVMQDTIGNMLESFGYTIKRVSDGRSAIDMFKMIRSANRPIAAMLLDLTIPGGMGGKEAVREIRLVDAKLPVFVASGYAEDPVMASPETYGFTASICKPFVKSDLAGMLHRYLVSAVPDEN